jgi:hypothetical protein
VDQPGRHQARERRDRRDTIQSLVNEGIILAGTGGRRVTRDEILAFL